MSARIEALRAEVHAAGLAAVAVVPGPNMLYLTGLSFHLSERPVLLLVPADGPLHAVVPELEAPKLDALDEAHSAYSYTDNEGPQGAFAACLGAAGLAERTCGVEGRRIRFLELDLMANSGAAPQIRGADEVFARLRMVKGEEELAAMRTAVLIAETAFSEVLPSLRAGVSEREAASRLTAALLAAGSEPELPFFPIVATGPNAALPHAVPTDRPMAAGDLVIVDWGARHDGYCSDITRTLQIAGAEPDPALIAAYAAVEAANAAGRAAVRPGVTGRAVDAAARDVIAAAGLGEAFLHRTGHGLGLETHEEPDIKAANAEPLPVGATFTVEPGVYLAGRGGIRIEDDVAVTESGSQTLTSLARRLVTVG